MGATTTTRISDYGANSNQITGMTENGTSLRSYSYDGVGSRPSARAPGVGGAKRSTGPFCRNCVPSRLTFTDVRGSEILAYSYNNRNRLISVTRNAVAHAAYQYNAFEQLVSRNAVGGTAGTVHYIYDLDGHLIAETNAATGATTREYLWLPANDNSNDTPAEQDGIRAANDNMAGGVVDLPLAVINVAATPVMFHVHSDHLGRPIRMTDAAKATVWQATWKPWGEPQSITGPQANNLRFPGQYFQLETGLAYNWHRHYDAITGRYIQPDPLGLFPGMNRYAYAENSPFIYTDRDGRIANFILGGVIGAGLEYLTNPCATWKDLAAAGALGAIGGGIAGKVFKSALKSGLSRATKGRVGEELAILKNRVKGRTLLRRHGRIPGQRAHRDAQYRGRDGRIFEGEAKWGDSDLSSAQRAAQKALGDGYVVDRFPYPLLTAPAGVVGGMAGEVWPSRQCGCQ